jgi:hypothetical protein
VKAATFVLFLLGLVYVGYANELMKAKVPDVHRFLVCVVFIYGSFRLSQEVPLLIYRMLWQGKKLG